MIEEEILLTKVDQFIEKVAACIIITMIMIQNWHAKVILIF